MLFIFAVINVKQTNLTTICDDEMNGESSPTHTNKIDNQGSDDDVRVYKSTFNSKLSNYLVFSVIIELRKNTLLSERNFF